MNHHFKFRANLLFALVLVLIQSIVTIELLAPVLAQHQQNTIVLPQGSECTYIRGVNVAGSVRVNNLANLEAMLNIFANGAEIAGLLFGFVLILRACLSGRTDLVVPLLKWKINRPAQFAIGCILMLIGLAIPAVINWLIASTGDINYFS